MKLLIEKKSKKKFPPPFEGDGFTAIAVGVCENGHDPKHRQAYVLENGQFVNCDQCNILKDLENPEEDIFDGVKFGDRFLTRAGFTAIYLGWNSKCSGHKFFIVNSETRLTLNRSGRYYSDGRENAIDIVERYDNYSDIIKDLDELEKRGYYITAEYGGCPHGYYCHIHTDDGRSIQTVGDITVYFTRWEALSVGIDYIKKILSNEKQK